MEIINIKFLVDEMLADVVNRNTSEYKANTSFVYDSFLFFLPAADQNHNYYTIRSEGCKVI